MNLNLKTDVEFNTKKKEIFDKIDAIIDSSKMNLTIKIQKQLENESDLKTERVLEMIYDDLEEKRINIKNHFYSQLETITIKAFNEAINKMI